jgi:isoleucyl-tRNA synthetase
LGGFYLDVIKDRLYCDAHDSERRLSAQSTVYDIAHTLVRLIAPIVPMTAEEMWEHLPGAEAGSIHLQTFNKVEPVSIDNAAWDKFFTMREALNTEMDVAKKDKIIGSSIAAKVSIPNLDVSFADAMGESYEQLLIVAEANIGDTLSIEAVSGSKCPRCYVVGTPADRSHEVHNELCQRCLDVVTG